MAGICISTFILKKENIMSVTVKLIINNDQLVGDIGFVNGNELVKDLLLSLIDKTSDICEQVTARVKQTLWSHKINFLEKNITDKQLDNFRWIGLIKLFFPNSKIILCKRNYKANALSIYKNNISSGYYNWTNDPEDILNYMEEQNITDVDFFFPADGCYVVPVQLLTSFPAPLYQLNGVRVCGVVYQTGDRFKHYRTIEDIAKLKFDPLVVKGKRKIRIV